MNLKSFFLSISIVVTAAAITSCTNKNDKTLNGASEKDKPNTV